MVRAMAAAKRELGRGERVLPGLWRLRLPLPFPGVPHCNAWAIAAGSGIVLVDTGMHQPGSMAQLERAMEQVRLRVEITSGDDGRGARHSAAVYARPISCGR